MTKEQARHARAIARKILTQVSSMESEMVSISQNTLEDVPVQTIEETFNELAHYMDRIYSILNDMLGGLNE